MRGFAALVFTFLTACAAVYPSPIATEPANAATELSLSTATQIAEITENAIFTAEGLAIADLQYPESGHLLASVAFPAESSVLRIAIRDGEGSLLARELVSTSGETGATIELFFAQEDEELYLVLCLENGQNQEIETNSVLLVFDGFGTLLASDSIATIELTTPQDGDRLATGSLRISGNVAWRRPGAVNVKLVTREGRVLISRDTYQSEDGSFSIELVPQISEAQWVQVVASQSRAGFTLALDSVEIWLEP